MKGTTITYKIDNHSEIIPISLLKDCYEYGKEIHHNFRKKEYVIKSNKIGCYILYDKNKKIIYIGKSINSIRQRIIQHLFANPSVYLNDYELKELLLKREKVKYFSYIEIDKQFVDFVEAGLINKYEPKLNKQFINNKK